MAHKTLVLTGLDRLWPEDETDHIFTGPWCFIRHSRYQFSDHRNFKMLPDLWSDHADIKKGLDRINDLMDRLIPALGQHLNQSFDVDQEPRSWIPTYISWLGNWLAITYDRYLTLKAANGEVSSVICPAIPKWQIESSDHHFDLLNTHSYNFILYAEILAELKELKGVDYALDQRSIDLSNLLPSEDQTIPTIKSRLLESLKDWVDRRSHIYVGAGGGINRLCGIGLALRCDPGLILRRAREVNQIVASSSSRTDCLSFQYQDEFEQIVSRLILKFIPRAIYRLNLMTPSPTVCLLSGLKNSTDTSYASATLLQGGKLCIFQHGGDYDQLASMPNEWIEYNYADHIATWGRAKAQNLEAHKWLNLPSPLLSRLPRRSHKAKSSILMFTNFVSPYPYRMQSSPSAFKVADLIDVDAKFVESLSPSKRAQVLLKPYIDDYGTGGNKRMTGLIPNISHKKLSHHLRQCRLLVISYMGTVIPEALHMNVPFIIYWPHGTFTFNERNTELFDRLREVGVFFTSAELAAAQVNSIEKYEHWWATPAIQDVRKEFLIANCHASDHWEKSWVECFREMIAATRLTMPAKQEGSGAYARLKTKYGSSGSSD